jgi:hypothetical protein
LSQTDHVATTGLTIDFGLARTRQIFLSPSRTGAAQVQGMDTMPTGQNIAAGVLVDRAAQHWNRRQTC